MKRHVGIFPGPVCTFCFVSEYGAWHRVDVCGLEEAVFQLTGTGSLYKMGIQLGPGISRFVKLAKPLEIFLSNPSLCPTHLFFYSFHPAHWIWMQFFHVAESTTLPSHLRSPRVLSGWNFSLFPMSHPLSIMFWLCCQSDTRAAQLLCLCTPHRGRKGGLKWSFLSFADRQGLGYASHLLPPPHPTQLLDTRNIFFSPQQVICPAWFSVSAMSEKIQKALLIAAIWSLDVNAFLSNF